MKIRFLLILFLLSALKISGQNQNIGIGTTSPNPKAILDLTSTTKGFLMPRMTYDDRLAIASPPNGLMVYQTNSIIIPASPSGIYFYHSGSWKRIARSDENNGGGTSGWTIAGDDQYHNLAGNVGIGTSSPTSKFHIVGNILQESGTFIINHSGGIIQFRNSNVNKAFMQLSGNNLRMGTNSGNSAGRFIIRMNNEENFMIDSTGYVGIGTTSPEKKLHINGGIAMIENNGSSVFGPLQPLLEFMLSSEDEKRGGLRFLNGNTVLGQFDYTVDLDGADYLRFSVGGPSDRDMILTSNARLGINMNGGIFDPLAQLHVKTSSGVDALAIHSTEQADQPTIQWYNSLPSGNPDAKKVFMQLSDGEDLRIGTNSANSTGKVVFRLAGNDRVWLNEDGEMGFGTEYPLAKLTIDNGQDADYNPTVGNGYIMMGNVGSTNLMLDNNEILARNDVGPSTLYVQQDGGLLKIGSGTAAEGTKVQITGGEGSSLSGHGYVVLGVPTGANMTMDVNEIQARSNGGASTLYLQRSGGNLDISGHTTIGGNGEILRLDGSNPNIGFYQNGTYKTFLAQDGADFYAGVNGGKMHLDATQIAIGSINSNASAYKLTVSGKVICEELKVELYSNWPDYVFSDQYELTPLSELKSFITKNKHLPNIPKADEVAKEGFEVGEMNRKLLEKIEELTLYIIDLQEQIDEMKAEDKSEAWRR